MTVDLKKAALAALLVVPLVACSSASDTEVTDTDILKGLFKGSGKAEAPNAAQIGAQVQAAMAATDAPLLLIALPERQGVAVMQEIETNGPYSTYGTRERISMTVRDGIVTATRGLGDDLMSSGVAAVANLVTRRQSGTVTRVQRFLDGENHEIALETTCSVSVGGTASVEVGGQARSTQSVTERCKARTTEFQNSYQVDRSSGRILQSKQWIGPVNGHMVLQVLQ